MDVTEFQDKLEKLGYLYGHDSAENALFGYNLALKDNQQAENATYEKAALHIEAVAENAGSVKLVVLGFAAKVRELIK